MQQLPPLPPPDAHGRYPSFQLVDRYDIHGNLTPEYKKKALTAFSNTPDIGIQSFYYLLDRAEATAHLTGRPPAENSGRRGRPARGALPGTMTFGEIMNMINGMHPYVEQQWANNAHGLQDDEEEEEDDTIE